MGKFKTIKAIYNFNGYNINNIVFKALNNEYKSKKVSISMQLGAKTKVADNLLDGQILLSAVFNGKEQKDHSNIFRLEIELIGYFQAESEQDEISFQKFLNLNGIATLMPFLRSSVADITRTANYGTILLPLINVHNLKKLDKQTNNNKTVPDKATNN